jgi:hypothetical protein
VQNKKVDVAAPEVVVNCNKCISGVNKHEKLWNTYALGKHHKFKKYQVKLLLFLMDSAMINTRIYFKMANSKEAKSNKSHADFFCEDCQ